MGSMEERLEQAFLELMLIQDPAHITVRMVTDRALASRTAFYNHYEDIPSMRAEIESRILLDMDDIFESYPYMNIQRVDYDTPLPMYVKSFKYVSDHATAFRALFGPYGSHDFANRYQAMIYDNHYKKAQEDGVGGARLSHIISFIVGGSTKLAVDWLNDLDSATPEEIALIATRMSLYPLYR